MKTHSTSYVIREIQMRTVMRFTTYLLDKPKSGTLKTSNSGKDIELLAMQNSTATLEDSFVVPYKT